MTRHISFILLDTLHDMSGTIFSVFVGVSDTNTTSPAAYPRFLDYIHYVSFEIHSNAHINIRAPLEDLVR